ncbi:MAG: hypothetical protein ABI867_00450 [Kofleriaceae bacterium]
MSIVFIAVIIVGTFGFMIFMKRKMNNQFAHMQAGALAPRLGLQLVEGNPEHNLATMSVQPGAQNLSSAKGFLRQMAVGQVGGTLGEFKLHMTGQPYGASVELVLYCREEYQPGFAENVTTTWSDLRLTVHARCHVAPFELRLRKEATGLESRRSDQPMPAQQFGDPTLDRRFVIECIDPHLPRHLAAVIATFAPTLMYVHVIASANQVSFVMTPTAVAASALGLEQILHVLVSIAAVFEGQPVPAMVVGQPALALA